MDKDKVRMWNIFKRLLGFFGTLLALYIALKFAIYFMPFLIAGILALTTEPIIKFNMNKLKMSRRMSSLIVVVCTVILIIAITVLGGTWLISKLADLSKNLPSMISDVSQNVKNVYDEMSESMLDYMSQEAIDRIFESLTGVLSTLGTYMQNLASSALKIVASVPKIILNIIVTILAFVFFTKDRVKIINLINFHFPEKWVKKSIEIKNEFFSTIIGYLKVYSKIIVITTIELIISFSVLNWIGFNIPNVVKLSIIIAIIDILPVLGIGTVLIPWAVWCFISGNTWLGLALLVVYVILTIIRQIIEPKLVSNQLGIHPIITLLAMYAGYKMVGFLGLILGPLALVVLRLVYAEQIEKGLIKSLVEE